MENVVFMLYSSLFSMLPTVLVTAGCVIILGKVKEVAVIMMLAANVILLISKASSSVVSFLLVNNSMKPEVFGKYIIGFRVALILASLVFALGFYLMANKIHTKVEHGG